MKLIDRINADLKESMLARDAFRTGVLRDLKSAFLYEEVAKNKRNEGLNDAELEAVIARECKKRDDSIEIYVAAGNTELSEKELAEREILMHYLPKQLSDDEICDIVNRVIETGGFAKQDMGRVIGAVKAEVGSQANGATVAKVVQQQLGA